MTDSNIPTPEPSTTLPTLRKSILKVLKREYRTSTASSSFHVEHDLRTIVLSSLNLTKDDKAAKKCYKNAVLQLEGEGRVDLDVDGCIRYVKKKDKEERHSENDASVSEPKKSKERKSKDGKKKRKKGQQEEEERSEEEHDKENDGSSKKKVKMTTYGTFGNEQEDTKGVDLEEGTMIAEANDKDKKKKHKKDKKKDKKLSDTISTNEEVTNKVAPVDISDDTFGNEQEDTKKVDLEEGTMIAEANDKDKKDKKKKDKKKKKKLSEPISTNEVAPVDISDDTFGNEQEDTKGVDQEEGTRIAENDKDKKKKHKKDKKKKDTKKDKKLSEPISTNEEVTNEVTSSDISDTENVIQNENPTDSTKPSSSEDNDSGTTRLFLGNLPYNVDESILETFLSPAVLTHVKWITDKETGRFYGSAFVEMKKSIDAATAMKNQNGKKLMGRPIKINYAEARESDVWPPAQGVLSSGITDKNNVKKGRQAGGEGIKGMKAKPEECKKLFMGNLSYAIDEVELMNFLSTVQVEEDKVKQIRWLSHMDTGEFKGCGYLEFWNTDTCETVATLNGKNLLGRPIRLDWAE